MSDRDQWLRALALGVALLAMMWAIRHVDGTREATAADSPGPGSQAEVALSADEPGVPLNVESSMLPFVAYDNTCLSRETADLSGCTGFLSGGAVHHYRLKIDRSLSVAVEVAPENGIYDIGFAVYGPERTCISGADLQPQGMIERTITSQLAEGLYDLVIGGYGGDCGPYRLTISEPQDLVGRLLHTTTTVGKNGRALRWETFGEIGLSHFVVYRMGSGIREQVAVLRSQGGPAATAHYRCLDRASDSGGDYEVVAVGRDGRTQSFYIPSVS